MINPGFRPSPIDPTLSNPGFFEQAQFPVMTPLLPISMPMVGALTGQTGKMSEKDMKAFAKDSKNLQKAYMENVMANMLQTSQQLSLGFASLLGGKPPG